MTAIIYRDGVVVTDGRCVDEGFIVSDSWTKVFELAQGGYIAFAGNTRYHELMKRWIETGESSGDRPNNFESSAIVFTPEGVIKEYEEDGLILSDASYPRAWGSGGGYAYAALLAGMSLQDAVKIACRCSPSCGGLIQTYDLTHLPGFQRFSV